VNKNSRLVLMLVGAFAFMLCASFAAVPIYRLFCPFAVQTGAQARARSAPKIIARQLVRVHFDANTNGIPWAFKADQSSQVVRVGKTTLAYFTVTNTADHPVTGRADYNVLPDTMHPYFLKLQCFCFQDQTLGPHESRTFPVVYFLDPKLRGDVDTRDVHDVTLSYTFFQKRQEKAPDQAMRSTRINHFRPPGPRAQ
jgi:cytochrome c oxidase assembly protein subunit 11